MQKLRRTYEQLYPYLGSLVIVLLLIKNQDSFQFLLSETQLTTTTTVSSILMGFLGTSYGILLSATTKRIQWAKGKKPLWLNIIRYFNISFIFNFLLCVFSIIISFSSNIDIPDKLQQIIFILMAALISLSVLSFFRAMRILLGLLKPD